MAAANDYVRVCYYTNWSQYRTQPMGYFPDDLDPYLCTHVVWAFAKIDGNFILSLDGTLSLSLSANSSLVAQLKISEASEKTRSARATRETKYLWY